MDILQMQSRSTRPFTTSMPDYSRPAGPSRGETSTGGGPHVLDTIDPSLLRALQEQRADGGEEQPASRGMDGAAQPASRGVDGAGQPERRHDGNVAFTPDGQYASQQTTVRNGVKSTTYFGGMNDRTQVFKTVDGPGFQQRTRCNGRTGAAEGTWTFDKKSGTESIHIPGGAVMTRTVDGRVTGTDSFGNRLDPKEAPEAWQSERERFDPPTQRRIQG